MYKLVTISGPKRGQEFILHDGTNTIGRSPECDISIAIEGISKKHLSITVTKDVAYLEDLNSANGTFVNEKMVKKITVKNGDRIAIPDMVMQLVHVEERKVIIKKKISNSSSAEDATDLDSVSMPSSPIGKILYLFKHKAMQLLYGVNEEYEWRLLFSLILTAFVILTVTATIFPVLSDSKRVLLTETKARVRSYANQIAATNALALEKRSYDQINTNFLDSESGVVSYELFTPKGKIIRPIGKLNENIADIYSVGALEELTEGRAAMDNDTEDVDLFEREMSDGGVVIGKTIKAFNLKTQSAEPVGIIVIKFAPPILTSLATKNSKLYLESISMSTLLAIVFFGIIYYLTCRPLEELRMQIEEALRGKRREVEGKYFMTELSPLKSSINNILQKMRELQGHNAEDQFGEVEDDAPYLNTLKELMLGSAGPALILNSEKNLSSINTMAEDLTGMRETTSIGESLLDVAKEKGFAAMLIELCDQSANNNGTCQKGTYELTGNEYTIFATALIGKDHFAKAFYISFVREMN
ncbi:MAG: hypothetical protein A2504_16230 [Bdellovibrionales bacterium RIFOXYD12_FULL_39_22]|nr:MAG: hypothetical protein A2385_08140 [Bdellovibrionales bacterium RIFOXYB1_FULL_39_21]OFZ42973.1 MAG: hypothetical protein A2485_11085 [Bdellovibrionales bacterium RIFOXYC12_FULL_39_17]OFZ50941.1 MAG: hypothetical protein A2404_07055 [Bdellovibrionales bacterium RIFOXYC1_FULL_39_130]OFZ78164.1 MAG: hypothetical protein A2560_02225 [Bdellovibrionales bacterium RIFOXYD1_FULL_39_84]OFZ94032.1 MAG: hypothetical protein A2504_16230 [Bdellovibrionales bacterium RIFOXYD12_FULL_39_22]HLE10484.1 FH